MAREKESYRDNLERLDKMFPGKEMLSTVDVAMFTGMARTTVLKMYSFKDTRNKSNTTHRISKAVLARELS
jgi:hypothetical protein